MFTETKFFHKAGEGSGGGGGGGSDPHNKGSFLTPEALRTAYPTAEPGDFAIVESTDTVWVWDSDGSDWKDGDTKGQVTSVNGQTGAVTLTIPAEIQVSTMPTAGADELGKVYQFIGTTDANYTNGYFYKCVSDGQDPATYSWTQTDVQPQGDSLPPQTGQSGKFLTTDGTDASWATVDALPSQSGQNGKVLGTDGTTASWVDPIQVSTMPTAAVGELGKVYQFIGTTDANYTHGYFYECKAQGTDPETYAWEAVEVQASSGGLPSQTGNAGKFLTTDGTDASWSDTPLVNKSTAGYGLTILGNRATSYSGFNIGYNSTANGSGFSVGNSSTSYTDCVAVGPATIAGSSGNSECVAIGPGAKAPKTGVISIGYYVNYNITPGQYSVAIGRGALTTGSNCCLINLSGTPNITNADSNTVKIANTNGNFEIMSADGTIPEARLADTTNAQQGDVLTLDSNGNAVWQAGGGGGATATTATLAAANWSSNSQTVSVTGVTASNVVYVMAAPASAAEYAAAGVQCTAQASGTLTFTCTTTPSSALTVNIAIF